MNFKEYKQMEKFEKTYWWHQGRFYLIGSLINKFLPKDKHLKFLEIGSGTGGTLEFLSQYGEPHGIDISDEAIKFCKEKGISNVHKGDVELDELPEHKGKYDAVFGLDVLEHIQKDVPTMKKLRSFLKPEGKLIVTVPAHKFLWSEHDEALHHKRRYNSVEMEQKLKDAGFEVEKYTYFVFFAFFPILLFRTWNNVFRRSSYPKSSYVEVPKILNDFGIFMLKLETFLIKMMWLPIGTTIVAVAKKK